MAIRRPKVVVIDEPKKKVKKAKVEKPIADIDPNAQAADDIIMLSKAVGITLSADQAKMLVEQIDAGSIDNTRPITFYLTEVDMPAGKDQQRIYDIIKKTQLEDGAVSICKSDFSKMEKLAVRMNNAIKDEEKRKARREACLHYGLGFLAECFPSKEPVPVEVKDNAKIEFQNLNIKFEDFFAGNNKYGEIFEYKDPLDPQFFGIDTAKDLIF